MIDSDNLRTASLYINNQLLSRGLLRDGQSIDFADPEASSGGLEATMGRVIAVVNDLILRRDRDAVQRESLSNTLLGLRAELQRQTTESTRQAERLADNQRKLDGAEGTERALRGQLKAAETAVVKLKDEMAKMRVLVAQSRAACATEVRKRDRQIDSLKKAVTDAGRVRGGGRNSNVMTITVTGDVGTDNRASGVARGGTDDDGYSLRMETNEFLTELARNLSEENSTLLELMRRTVDSLREMSGLEESQEDLIKSAAVGGGSHVSEQRSAQELASELEGIMEHLKTILTNPSFVPIEEVVLRDTEIARLREGFVRMESRWKDAVRLIDGWRQRVASGGKTVNEEELQMGLRLSPVRVRDIPETDELEEVHHDLSCVQEKAEEEEQVPLERPKSLSPEDSLHLVPAPGYEEAADAEDSDSSSIFQDDIDIDALDAEEPNVEILQESVATSMDSPPMPAPPQLSPLRDSYSFGNRRAAQPSQKKRGDYTTIVEESTQDFVDSNAPPPPPPHAVKPQSPTKSKKLGSLQDEEEYLKPSSSASFDSPLFGDSIESPLRANPNRKLFSKPSGPAEAPAPAPAPAEAADINAPYRHDIRMDSTRRSKSKTQTSGRLQDINASPDPATKPSSTKPKGPATRTTSDPNPASQPQEHSTQPTSRSTTTAEPRNKSPVRPPASSRLPRPNPSQPQQSPLTLATIAAKLAASERDADAARVRAKLKAARLGGKRQPRVAPTQVPLPEDKDEEEGVVEGVAVVDLDPVKKDSTTMEKERREQAMRESPDAEEQQQQHPTELKPEKRKRDRRVSKVASRRRSTLSPWELESLIQGTAAAVESPAR